MAKTTLLQKFSLFLFALIVTVFLLETGLRLGGWLFLSLQERANRQKVTATSTLGQEFRILCLGESTTALGGDDSYPRQLEKILNSRQNTIKFKVINKGVPSTTTDQILARVQNYFTEYQPQMVVAMMGINDPQSPQQWTWRDQWSRYSKAFKLFDMIVRHWAAKEKSANEILIEKQIAAVESQLPQMYPSEIDREIARVNLYRSANRPQQEKTAIDKALMLDPQNSTAWYLLGVYYDRQAEHEKALDAYRKAEFNVAPENKLKILERIAECQNFLGNRNSALQIYAGIVKQWPRHPQANGALADILVEQGQFEEAIVYYLRQISVDPQKEGVFDKLVHCYNKTGQPEKAREILAHHPKSQGGKIKRMPQESGSYNAVTKDNYLKLVKMTAQRRVPLIAVQYPHRSVAPLREMLSSANGVVFVDNEKVFSEALAARPYDEIFVDRFAGDFGHCTPDGNKLLASHVADQSLKTVFSNKIP